LKIKSDTFLYPTLYWYPRLGSCCPNFKMNNWAFDKMSFSFCTNYQWIKDNRRWLSLITYACSERSAKSESDGSERISWSVRQAQAGPVWCGQVETKDKDGQSQSQPDLERVVFVVSCTVDSQSHHFSQSHSVNSAGTGQYDVRHIYFGISLPQIGVFYQQKVSLLLRKKNWNVCAVCMYNTLWLFEISCPSSLLVIYETRIF